MTDDESYDMDEALEAAEDVADYFEDINSYDREDFEMEEESEVAREAVGAIGAFASSVEELDQYTDQVIEGDYNEADLRNAVMQAGVAWPDAMKAYQAINNMSEEVVDKFAAAAFHGDQQVESVGNTVEELRNVQRQYQEAQASATAHSKTLGPKGYDTPVDIALEVTEDEEVVEELQELEEDIPRTQEEERQQLQEMIEGLQ